MKHLKHPDLATLVAFFPTSGNYRNGPRKGQSAIMEHVAKHGASIIEGGTGTGKTASEYGILRGAESCMAEGPFFWVAPNKTIVAQHAREFPQVTVAYGRNEHPCLYYLRQDVIEPERLVTLCDDGCYRADDVPCSMLRNCPHRVNQQTGETFVKGATPCPYLQQKYEVSQGGIVLCTMAFYLFTTLFSGKKEQTGALVIDEAHRMADVVRNCLSYDITDYHVAQSIALLERIGAEESKVLKKFLDALIEIIKPKAAPEGELLTEAEIKRLIRILMKIDTDVLLEKIQKAVRSGLIDPESDRTTLKRLETLVRNLRRYIHTFEYSLETDEHPAMNYSCAFYVQELDEDQRVQHRLVIKCYSVAGLIRRVKPRFTVEFSATIGDPEIFGFETGTKAPFLSLPPPFPPENTRIYMPNDVPNLAVKSAGRADKARMLRRIAKACVQFAANGQRSLVVVISNEERQRFLQIAAEEGLNAVSYGNGVTARDAATKFRDGNGTVLVGTAANYAEGVDLPKQTAPVIFFLRPGYPNPRDPGTKFEEQRFGGQRWALWNWRVMQQVIQVRGRNVRGHRDVGVTILCSEQFRRFAFGALPQEMQQCYRGQWSFNACVADAQKILAPKA